MRVCEYIHLFTSKVGYCLYLSFWGVRANRIALKTKVFVSNSSWMWELKYLYIYNCKMIPNIISKCIFHQSARFRPVLFLPYLTCILSVSVNLKTNLSSIKMSHAWWFFYRQLSKTEQYIKSLCHCWLICIQNFIIYDMIELASGDCCILWFLCVYINIYV